MFIRVIDWGYCQSCWFFLFRPRFVNCCAANFLSGSTLSTPLWYGILDLRKINTCLKVPLQINFFRWRHLALPSTSLIFLRALRSLANDRARDLFHHPEASPEWDDRWAAHPRHRSQPAHDNDYDFPTPHRRRRYLRAFLAWDGRREKLAQDIYNQIFQ